MRCSRSTRLIALAALFLLTACTSVKRNPVPIEQIDRAVIPGMPDVRDWGNRPSRKFQQDLVQSVRDEWAQQPPEPGQPLSMNLLLLSGGGSNGAFGAGFLNGWTVSGTRPVFKLVTGISTGALAAPFAFLGPDYDDELERVYTTTKNRDIFKIRNPLTVYKKDSLAHTKPLAATLEKIVDRQMIDAIAAEHRKGRRLLVGTTNLDAQRLMVWNMGAIAASGHPDSIALFRQVLLASASIPVAFPPAYIEVEVDGTRYDEMHVDGGVIAEFFLWGAMVDMAEAVEELGLDPDHRMEASIYVIRNSQIDAAPTQVDPNLLDIASRSMMTILKAVAIADLVRISAQAEREGVGLYYVGIPPEHSETPVGAFQPPQMRRLFELGRALALEDEPWRSEPPEWLQ
jgi:predicted acylesterase/phospholipase RssA